MATLEAKATRRAQSLQKLSETAGALAGSLGIDTPPLVGIGRDPEIAQAQTIENVTAFLEQVGVAIEQFKTSPEKPKPKPKTAE